MSTSAATLGTRNRYLRWLETAAMWTFAAPFFLLGLLLIIGLPGALAVRVVEWTFEWGVLGVEIAVVVLLMVATVAALWWAFAHGGVISRLHLGRLEPTIRALAVAVFSIATFSGLTALLYVEGALEIRGSAIPDDVIVDKASEVYVWHLVDTVPLLDITSNLRWEPTFEFDDRLGGLLLVTFKGFVILPLVQVARSIFAGRRETYPTAVMTAVRRAAKDARITESAGGNRMIVQDEGRLIRVDVMSEVWTEDAPMRRVRGLASLEPGPSGYLLVVDGIADRARDRIEQAFAEAPFPARLLVWRSDEPTAPIQEALSSLREESSASVGSSPG